MSHNAPAPRGSLPLGLVLGVIVGAIAVMFAWFAVVDDPDRATPAKSASPAASTPAQQSPGPTPTPSPVDTPSPTPTPEPTPTPTPSLNPDVLTELPVGSWVTVLASLPKGSVTSDQAVARAARESRNGYTAVVIDTDRFTGLTRGYWAVVIPGADSRAASNAVCADLGIAVSNKCYPREIKG